LFGSDPGLEALHFSRLSSALMYLWHDSSSKSA
jgi:hypothetical protein